MPGLTDEDIAQLEAQQAPAEAGAGLTDEQMAQLEAQASKTPITTSTGEAFALGASQALPLGDELAGASGLVEKGLAKGRQLYNQFTGQEQNPVDERILNTPTDELATETRDMLKSAETEHPIAYTGGQLAGQIALTAPFAAEAPILSSTAMAATAGALGEGDLAKRATDATVQGTLAAGFGLGLKGLAKLPQVGTALKGVARDMSVRLLKLKPSVIEHMPIKRLEKLGTVLADERLISKPAMLHTVASNVAKETDNVGRFLGQTYDDLSKAGGEVPLQSVVDDVLGRLRANKEVTRLSSFADAEKDLLDFALRDGQKTFTIKDVWKLAGKLESEGKVFEKAVAAADNTKGALLKETARALREQVAERAANLSPQMADDIKAASSLFHSLADANTALQSQVKTARFAGRKSVKDVAARVVDAVTGGVPTRTAVISGARGMAKAADKLLTPVDKAIQKAGAKVGRFGPTLQRAMGRGPQSLASTHYVLMQTQPEYRQAILDQPQEDANDESGY